MAMTDIYPDVFSPTYGVDVQNALARIAQAYGRVRTIALTDGDVTLSATDCRFAALRFTGALTANRTITLTRTDGTPNLFVVENATTGGRTLILKVTNTGASVNVTPGQSLRVRSVNSTDLELDPSINTTTTTTDGFNIQDEGVGLGIVTTLNIVGAFLQATKSGNTATLTLAALNEAGLLLTDVTNWNVNSGRHGFAPKLPASSQTAKFLRGDGQWHGSNPDLPDGSLPVASGDTFAAVNLGDYFRVVTNALQHKETLHFALSDESTTLTTGTKLTFRMPFEMDATRVKATLTTASTSGLVTVNIQHNGVTIFDTKLTIDPTHKTSDTASTPFLFSKPELDNDAEITVDIDTAGTGATGLKVVLEGWRL